MSTSAKSSRVIQDVKYNTIHYNFHKCLQVHDVYSDKEKALGIKYI